MYTFSTFSPCAWSCVCIRAQTCVFCAWDVGRQMLLFACKCFFCWIYSCHPSPKISTLSSSDSQTQVWLCVLLLLHWVTPGVYAPVDWHQDEWYRSLISGLPRSVSAWKTEHKKLTGWMKGSTDTVQSTTVDNIIQKNSWVQRAWLTEAASGWYQANWTSVDGYFTFWGQVSEQLQFDG